MLIPEGVMFIMIEVIYKEKKQEGESGERIFCIPRNIRQIGLAGGSVRIYIEDYVYTFLGRLTGAGEKEEKERGSVAVFTGETKWNNGITYVFIRGAVVVEETEIAADHIDFSEQVWSRIQENQTRYFPEQEIVGWFFSWPQMYMTANELLLRIHLKYFGGEKVLMLMEPMEREDAFFYFENGTLVRQRGYYIYYEKNPQMQEYMIERNKKSLSEIAEKVEDGAVISFRERVQNKKTAKTKDNSKEKEAELEEVHSSVFSYAATACLILAILAVGNGVLKNYKNTERKIGEPTVRVISENVAATPKLTETNMQEGKTLITEVVTPTAVTEKAAERQVQSEESVMEEESIEETAMEELTELTEETVTEETTEKDTAEGNLTEKETFPEESDARKEKNSTEASSDAVNKTYVIKPGDTLYQISLSYYGNLDAIAEICRLNDLTENQVIYPGQMIVLP